MQDQIQTSFPSFGYYPYLAVLMAGLVVMRSYKSFMNVIMGRGIILRILGYLVMFFASILGIVGSLIQSASMNVIEFGSFHWPVITFFFLELIVWELMSLVPQMMYCQIVLKEKKGSLYTFFAHPAVLKYYRNRIIKD